jgi:hypothetical protein
MLLLVLAAAAAAPSHLKVKGIDYGPQVVISGTWFSNFENSRFAECMGKRCDALRLEDDASIDCVNGACGALDHAALRLTHQKYDAAPDGSFEIRFVGRRGLYTHEPRWLGDGGRSVLIEHLLSVKKVPDR